MEGLLARGVASSLNPNADGEKTLSDPETRALWELAERGTDSLRLRFLDEATHDWITLTQLRARSEPALIASVGLDPGRRAGLPAN